MKLTILSLTFTALLFSCSTAELSSEGSSVEFIMEKPEGDCKNLGPIFGKGGGSFGGAYISDEKLMEYAMNDLRNKAASKGATHVLSKGHQMGGTVGKFGGSTSTSTVTGIGYRCTL